MANMTYREWASGAGGLGNQPKTGYYQEPIVSKEDEQRRVKSRGKDSYVDPASLYAARRGKRNKGSVEDEQVSSRAWLYGDTDVRPDNYDPAGSPGRPAQINTAQDLARRKKEVLEKLRAQGLGGPGQPPGPKGPALTPRGPAAVPGGPMPPPGSQTGNQPYVGFQKGKNKPNHLNFPGIPIKDYVDPWNRPGNPRTRDDYTVTPYDPSGLPGTRIP